MPADVNENRCVATPAALYEALFERLLPPALPFPVRCAEVFGILPERYDPFAPGLRQVHPFPDVDALPGDRPYHVRAAACVHPPTSGLQVDVLRVYVGPVEWQGPDDAVVEAGISIDGRGTEHWVWRLGRVSAAWVVLRCDLVWRGWMP